MECQEALNEIGRLNDGELPAAERAALEAHFSGCESCRQAYEGLRASDAQLLRAFLPRRQAATAVADRVIGQLRDQRQSRSRLVSWSSLLVAAAAGFLLAVMVISPRGRHELVGDVPVARLSLATGPTEMRSPRQIAWLGCPTNGEIEAGASVRTAPGARCELQVSDGTQIRLDRGTEIEMPQPRTVKMTKGELYSCVSGEGGPLRVETPDAQIEAARGTFDFACSPGEASLTVIDGSASVACESGTRRVAPGERVRLVGGRLQDAVPVGDLLQTTAWINELLALKGADNPEFAERLNDILAQVGQSKLSYLYEDEIRRLGTPAVLPLIRYVQSTRSQGNEAARISAARIASDLADSTAVGDLIRLLADHEPRVRVYSAQALERLTGKNQGRPAAAWSEDVPDCQPALDAWAAWWREQGEHRIGVDKQNQ